MQEMDTAQPSVADAEQSKTKRGSESTTRSSNKRRSSLDADVDPWDLIDEDDDFVKWAGTVCRYKI